MLRHPGTGLFAFGPHIQELKMALVKQLFLGPKKPKGPDAQLIRSSRLQAARAREEDKRLEEEAQSQIRRAFSSGRILLFGAGSKPAGGNIGGGVPGSSVLGGGGNQSGSGSGSGQTPGSQPGGGGLGGGVRPTDL